MLLAGILWARPASVTAYSAKLPAAELIARSPGLKSFTPLPTASTSPAHSRPTMVPVPPTVPWRWPDATARSARLSEAARTLIRISCGLGTGLATSRISTPFSPTTAAFIFPPLRRHRLHASAISAISASAMPIRADSAVAEGGGVSAVSASDMPIRTYGPPWADAPESCRDQFAVFAVFPEVVSARRQGWGPFRRARVRDSRAMSAARFLEECVDAGGNGRTMEQAADPSERRKKNG